jgi:hypothetical protein
MSRPVKRRTIKSYGRDIEHLTRLRTAIKLDRTLTNPLAETTCLQIDTLMSHLIELIRMQEEAVKK